MANILPKHYKQTLDNGLEIYVIPMHNNTGVITTDIFYKVGSRNEIMGKSGIAHMLEHLNFKSTKNLKAGEFDTVVKSYGGVNNASTSFDYTHYYIKSSTKNLDNSLGLFAELMQNLNLKDEEFQPERNVVAEERRWRTDNSPMGYLYFKLFNNAFTYHPYHWTPIGFMQDIQNWTIEDIKSFHETYYQPQNAFIVIAGDVDKELAFSQAKKHFENIKNKKPLPKFYFKEPKLDESKSIVVNKESEVQMLALGFRIPNFQHEDQLALSVISEILSNGKSSRLYKHLVDDKKLVNQVYAYNMEQTDESLFLFLAVCNPNVDANAVKKEFELLIQELKEKEITQEELEKVKTNIKASFVFSLENSSSVADLFGSYIARGDLQPLFNYETEISKITTKDIKTVANKYFTDKFVTIILRKDNQ